jgi:hypothetical protein
VNERTFMLSNTAIALLDLANSRRIETHLFEKFAECDVVFRIIINCVQFVGDALGGGGGAEVGVNIGESLHVVGCVWLCSLLTLGL